MTARARFDGFDGLRGIAALAVLLHHSSFSAGLMTPGTAPNRAVAGLFTHGDIGVAVFFLISGFLLYRPFVARALDGTPEPPVGGFLLRRAARIFPAYWLALTVIIVVFKLQHAIHGGIPGYLRYYGLVHIYRNIGEGSGGVSQAWTLAVEITFYCFLPLWAALTRRLTRRAPRSRLLWWHLATLVALYGVGVAFRALCYWGPSTTLKEVGEYWLFANLDLFALGMALAVLSAGDDAGLVSRAVVNKIADIGEAWWLAAIGLYLLVSTSLGLPLGLDRPSGFHGHEKQALHGIIALFLLLPVVFPAARRNAVALCTRWRPLVYCGVVSYGIYLWHQAWIGKAVEWQRQPVFRASMPLLVTFGFAAATATATLSWFAFERPIVRLAGRFRSSAAPSQ